MEVKFKLIRTPLEFQSFLVIDGAVLRIEDAQQLGRRERLAVLAALDERTKQKPLENAMRQ